MRVLITGNSHCVSLAEGLIRIHDAGALPEGLEIMIVPMGPLAGIGKFFEVRGRQVVITYPRYRKRIPYFCPDETPFDWIGFSSAFHSRVVWAKRDWVNFCLPSIEARGAPLSNALVRRAAGEHNFHLLEFVKALQAVGFNTFAMECPKPFAHNPEITYAGPETVRYVDAQYVAQTQRTLSAAQIPVIRMPESTYDADGFTLPAFRHDNPEDRHHGNGDIGEIMMWEVIRFLQAQRTAKP